MMERIGRGIKAKVLMWLMILVIAISGGGLCNTTTVVKADMTVYITKTGEKYHTHKCGNGTYFPSSLSEARDMGLTACSKCFPNGTPRSSYSVSNTTHRVTTKPKVVKPIEISETPLTLLKGKTKKLKIKYATQSIRWKTSKKSVATVSKNGIVKGKKAGKAIITAVIGEKTKKCSVIVEAPKISKSNINIEVGQTETLQLKGCKHHIKWYSNDSDIVKVSKGKIKAKEIGTTKIYAVCHGKKFSCKIKVTPTQEKKVALPAIENISLNIPEMHMLVNEYQEIYATIYPINALTYYNIIWKSEDDNIVQIRYDANGSATLYAVHSGETNIVVTVGDKKTNCHIVVQ